MSQIERVIEVTAQQVSASRGVNLVLNRGQVLGTTADFDLTPQVADVVNKVLPTGRDPTGRDLTHEVQRAGRRSACQRHARSNAGEKLT